MIIAVDGPAASGKGTLARRLADHLGFAYLDTGLLYRAVGAAVLAAGGDPNDPHAAADAARRLCPTDLDAGTLRDEQVADAASRVAALAEVRAALLAFQRGFAADPPGGAAGAVLDGRDIGTAVCPDADLKFFVEASLQARAERRLRELQGRGIETIHQTVLDDLRARDQRDSARAASPLVPAADAIRVDTSLMDADQVFRLALRYLPGDTA